ncbi:uncharacterized protein LOC116158932 [Photinus pyralis]|uniref:uncharacterized protein LOC116158932 n=1 Tax=Photinus pyralis TaxID=7054 RepID=UPI001267262F|nr:uncharacterized protein LOC116158932 [Photinus pyralis]
MDDWDEEKVLLLIQLYREKENIWNPRNENYKKTHLKVDTWNEIGDALASTGEICKKKMTSVLSSYRREKAKETNTHGTGKGSAEVYKSRWFAYDALAFLNERNQPRKRSNTVIDDEKNVNETSAEEKVDQAEPRSAPIPPKKKQPTD